eukprot:5969638-Amphidinium_carterae.2
MRTSPLTCHTSGRVGDVKTDSPAQHATVNSSQNQAVRKPLFILSVPRNAGKLKVVGACPWPLDLELCGQTWLIGRNETFNEDAALGNNVKFVEIGSLIKLWM